MGKGSIKTEEVAAGPQKTPVILGMRREIATDPWYTVFTLSLSRAFSQCDAFRGKKGPHLRFPHWQELASTGEWEQKNPWECLCLMYVHEFRRDLYPPTTSRKIVYNLDKLWDFGSGFPYIA